jgi:hypothetical protein
VEANDDARIESELNALQQATYELSSRLYQQTAASEGGAQAPGGNGYHPGTETTGARPEGDVIDAEFKSEER